jgi:hypothetical protein
MHGVLHGIYLPGAADPDPASYRPADPGCFSLTVTAAVGPSEPPAAQEELDFHVCTASWLAANSPPKGFEFLRGTILLPRWDYAVLRRAIGDLCLHAEAPTWAEVASKLAREGCW